jgi:uncharacterized protein (TIRG00374 family)
MLNGSIPSFRGWQVEKARNWIVGLIISALALVVAFWGVKPERFLEALSGADYILLIPAALVILLGLIARACSWQTLLRSQIGLRRTFDALTEGYLLNTVLPLRLGELARAYIVSQSMETTASFILATVLVERIIDTLVSLIGLIVALPFVISPSWTQNLVIGVIVILVIIVLFLALLLSQRRKLLQILRKLPGGGFWGLDEAADEFIGSLNVIMDLGLLLKATFWSLMAWATTWLQLWILLTMFGIHGSVIVSLFVSGVIAFGAAVPSSPGAIGVFELSAVAGLLVFGYPREVALSFAIVTHFLQLFMTGTFGAWALAREGRTIMDLATKTQNFFRRVQNRVVS